MLTDFCGGGGGGSPTNLGGGGGSITSTGCVGGGGAIANAGRLGGGGEVDVIGFGMGRCVVGVVVETSRLPSDIVLVGADSSFSSKQQQQRR